MLRSKYKKNDILLPQKHEVGGSQETHNSSISWSCTSVDFNHNDNIITGGNNSLSKKIDCDTMESVLQRYQEHLCGEYRNKTTIKNNFNIARRFCQETKGIFISESVQKWRREINNTKSHNTINVSVSGVNKFLTWIGKPNLCMKTIGQQDTDKETLKENEIDAMIEQSRDDPETHLVVLLLFHALRPREIINLKFSNLVGDTLYLKETKTGNNHTIITRQIQDAIEQYKAIRPLAKQGYEDYLLLCVHSATRGESYRTILPIEKKIRSLAESIGINKIVTPYTIRRTSATLRLSKDSKYFAGNPKIVQRLFRHRDVGTTLRYDHISDDELRGYVRPPEKDLNETGKDLMESGKDLTKIKRTYPLYNYLPPTETNESVEDNSSFSFSFFFSFFNESRQLIKFFLAQTELVQNVDRVGCFRAFVRTRSAPPNIEGVF